MKAGLICLCALGMSNFAITKSPNSLPWSNTAGLDVVIGVVPPRARIECVDLGQELVSSAMDRMKVLGIGGL